MKTISILALPLALASQSALAGFATGGGALAMAALVGEYAPSVESMEKIVLQDLLGGQVNMPYPANKKIDVKADAVSCKIEKYTTCELTFGSKKVTTNGRSAHELYATLGEIGVLRMGKSTSFTLVPRVDPLPADIIFTALSNLNCTIDPGEVRRRAFNGAQCSYDQATPTR